MKPETTLRIEIAILAKAPIAGLAKTRLIPHLGADGAAALQRWLLQRTVAAAVVADLGPVTLWCAPDINHPEFAVCRAFGAVALRRQPDGDLGQRMHAAIAESSTSAGTLVIGTDCAVLTPGLLRQAAESLQQHDATVVPAEDGGYVLIGMREAGRDAFHAVDWSTERVMAQTRARLTAMNWRWSEFPPLWDVDRKEDFERLAELFPDARALAPQIAALE
ncbi:MAG: TIGR04282 family arsenosugar biosynthesis glycosyltransferase [Gammaproteobacteria bacterium]|nr:TIGR04282 family arsenosugar biosynthesis glycosyltransferase [Gammaproteobacteria bacterium]MBU2435620.1 TIGR04282 family arsenosugar biosynthesis glycosyltransferase [Gammaproteobacteria bacterium]MBU2449599.1 TIGR04282 family arsenosugar biosynthesis glycosyltransferase [Gammaproteobacteria bacterium]